MPQFCSWWTAISNSTQFINPMDINANYSEEDNPLSLKADFILSLCELVVGGKEGLLPVEKTVIDRCVHLIYRKYFADPCPENMPILEDLYDEKQGLSNGKGVSCILVNTNQGKATLEQCEGQFVLMTSDFEKVARHNDQLHSPSKYSPKREQILELYQKEGYEAVDRYFHKNYKKDILKYTVSGMLPKGLKRNIKKMACKIKNK